MAESSKKKRGPYNRAKYIENVKEPRCTTWLKKKRLSEFSEAVSLPGSKPLIPSNAEDLDHTR